MSDRDSDDQEKEYEATQKRLDEARKRGEVPRSPEITTAAAYGGLVLAALIAGPATVDRLGALGTGFLAQPDRLGATILGPGDGALGGILASFAVAIAPFFVAPIILVIVALVAQRAIIFTPEKLMPKASRVSPLSNAKQKFGRSGLFEFAKSFVKLVVISSILGLFLAARMDEILATLALPPGPVARHLGELVIAFLFLTLIVAASIAIIDYLWQRAEHLRRNRMSHKDMKDEMKESEGDPHLRQKRRQRGYEIATRRMIADVAKSDVVIVNPTHFAVALRWRRTDQAAPVCLAKGVDAVAARIREAAQEGGIPLYRDAATARRLHAEVEIGDEILPAHYRAVAAAIRFSEKMRKKAGRTWR